MAEVLTGTRGVVVGVVGARGGVGASTFAALLAGRLAGRTATVLVDLAGGAGLDVLLGLEGDPGPRWPDLTGAGDLPGARVLDALPRWGSCAVLSTDRWRPLAPSPDLAARVLDGLVPATGALVLDLARSDVVAGRAPVGTCDLVVVVAGRDLASAGGAVALRDGLADVGDRVGLAVRGPAPGGLSVTELAAAVALPVLCRVPTERALAQATERAALRLRGRTARTAEQVARTAMERRAS